MSKAHNAVAFCHLFHALPHGIKICASGLLLASAWPWLNVVQTVWAMMSCFRRMSRLRRRLTNREERWQLWLLTDAEVRRGLRRGKGCVAWKTNGSINDALLEPCFHHVSPLAHGCYLWIWLFWWCGVFRVMTMTATAILPLGMKTIMQTVKEGWRWSKQWKCQWGRWWGWWGWWWWWRWWCWWWWWWWWQWQWRRRWRWRWWCRWRWQWWWRWWSRWWWWSENAPVMAQETGLQRNIFMWGKHTADENAWNA